METPNSSNRHDRIDLEYNSVPRRTSSLAIASLILGPVAILLSFVGIGFFIGIAAIICGVCAERAIAKNPLALSGKLQLNLGAAGGGLGMLITLWLVSSCGCGGSRELSNRTYCQANLRGIMQTMQVYAGENGSVYPVLPFAAYGTANGLPTVDAGPSASISATTLNPLFAPKAPLQGSPLANMWLLVEYAQVTPKQFVCKSDPWAGRAAESLREPNVSYLNFQKQDELSYAFAYPYMVDGSVGKWWKNTMDSTLPLIADMPAVNGTGGATKVDVSPGKMPAHSKIWNSADHNGEGESVAYADGHAEFVRRPDVGQSSDNIFTYTGTRFVSQFGGVQPTLAPLSIQTDAAPFDVVMVPARNLNTGGLY